MNLNIAVGNRYVSISSEDLWLLRVFTWRWRKDGYLVRTSHRNGKPRTHFFHQYVKGPRIGFLIDHIDRNPANNARDNLRYVTPQENVFNSKRLDSCVGYRGIARHRNKFRAQCMIDGKLQIIGSSFKSAEEAARAYDAYVVAHAPQTAYLNFPEDRMNYEDQALMKTSHTLRFTKSEAKLWDDNVALITNSRQTELRQLFPDGIKVEDLVFPERHDVLLEHFRQVDGVCEILHMPHLFKVSLWLEILLTTPR